MKKVYLSALIAFHSCLPFLTTAQVNPLLNSQKVKNYLPHMTSNEIDSLLQKSDLVIIPISALEQHASHLPIGTDFLNGVELCKLIAQESDILVAPVLMAGQSPYHMGFTGTITLSAETIIKVHLEAVQSLIEHGFKRFIIMSSHGGNDAIVGFIVDQVNQTTSGIAVNYDKAVEPFLEPIQSYGGHAGTGETSKSLYLIPNLVKMNRIGTTTSTLPKHLKDMQGSVATDPTTRLVFLAEILKDESTGKKSSSSEISSSGVVGPFDLEKTNVQFGEDIVIRHVRAATEFISKWNDLVKK